MSKKKPLINILTRTSNRPNGFKMNRKSIEDQTYKNIRHLVSVDDYATEEYVKKYTSDYYIMNRDILFRNDKSKDPKTGGRAIHNLYLNELIKQVKDGYIMFLDDDDVLADPNTIQRIVDNIEGEDTLIMWQMDFPSKINPLIPKIEDLGKEPVLGRIGAPCFLFHFKYGIHHKWDGWKCSDFRFVSKLYDSIPNKKTIPEPMVVINQIGRGKRNDIDLSKLRQVTTPTKLEEPILEEAKDVNDTVAVIFCNWARGNNIAKIMNCLKMQTYQNFDVFVWNNNRKDAEYLSKYSRLNVFNSFKNIGGIGRFYLAKMIAHEYDKIIFFDDDQTFGPNFILNMANAWEPRTIKSRWAWKLSKGGYFNRKRVTGNDLANYVGTGGMVLDSSIFEYDDIFDIPEEYRFIEDLWLSYFSNSKGFTNHGINETLTQHEDGKDQYLKLGQKKDEFYQKLLNDYGWDIELDNKEYDYIVAITSYNRYEMLVNMINRILSLRKNIKIIVSDDSSPDPRYLRLPKEYPDVSFVRTETNNGKIGYWKTINLLFSKIKQYKSKSVIHLDDDFELSNDLFDDLDKLNSEDFIILSCHTNYNSMKKWGTDNHVDGCFTIPMSYLKKTGFMLDEIPISRFESNPKISSGTWEQVTRKLNDLGYKTKYPGYSLCKHIGNEMSEMNPIERRLRPIITYRFKDELND